MKTIEIIISPTGELRIESRGYVGRECLGATRRLEAALGVKTGDFLTGDFFRAASATQEQLPERS